MKTINEEQQKKGNRYFCCMPRSPRHYQFLVVTASQAAQIASNAQHQSSDDPVRDWAYFTLWQTFGGNGPNLPGFRELSQETGDRMQVMSDVLSGRVTIEELKAAEDAS